MNKTALLGALAATAVLVGCGTNHNARGDGTHVVASRSTPSFCTLVAALKPAPSFTSEADAIRAAAPLAPTWLEDDVRFVMLAYEQMQDSEDGAISPSQMTLPHSVELQHAMAAIDYDTLRTCGFHAAAVLPQ